MLQAEMQASLSGLPVAAVPPIKSATMNTVVWASVGLLAFSFGVYLMFRRKDVKS